MRVMVNGAVNWWYALVAAFQLLSRIPVPLQVPFEETVLRRSLLFYPLVGLVMGAVLAGAGILLPAVLPDLVVGALLTVLWIGLTGGLHMDGLMDTADGLLSHRSRERMLEIMKDSRVGAMGAIACVLQVLVKFVLLVSILPAGKLAVGVTLLVVPLWSRWFVTAAVVLWPYARIGPGMGALLVGAGKKELAGSSVFAVLLSLSALQGAGLGQLEGFALTAAGALVAGGFGWYTAYRIARKLGGQTGDTYGAINELVETALLLAALLYFTV